MTYKKHIALILLSNQHIYQCHLQELSQLHLKMRTPGVAMFHHKKLQHLPLHFFFFLQNSLLAMLGNSSEALCIESSATSSYTDAIFCCISSNDFIYMGGGIFIRPQKVLRTMCPLPISLIAIMARLFILNDWLSHLGVWFKRLLM